MQKGRGVKKPDLSGKAKMLTAIPFGVIAGDLVVTELETGHQFGGRVKVVEPHKNQLRVIFRVRFCRSSADAPWETDPSSPVWRTTFKWAKALEAGDGVYRFAATGSYGAVEVAVSERQNALILRRYALCDEVQAQPGEQEQRTLLQ
ncbi:MAG: hypothetical protein ABIG66_01785 [Candidatus Kerfeldbacteria bacterium]